MARKIQYSLGEDDLRVAGNILYRGTPKDDTFHGKSGDDTISGDKGNDKLYGDKGNDGVYGQNDNDKLFGEAGYDVLDGGHRQRPVEGWVGGRLFRLQDEIRQGRDPRFRTRRHHHA